MVDLDGNASATSLLHEFSCFLNRLGAIHLRSLDRIDRPVT
jgi:hypothetical protein